MFVRALLSSPFFSPVLGLQRPHWRGRSLYSLARDVVRRLSITTELKKLATALASGRAAALATTLAAAAGMALEMTLTRAVLVTQPSVQTVEMGVVVDVLTALLSVLTALLAVLTAAPEMLRAAMLAGMLRPLQAASMTAVLAVSTAALEVLPAALVVLTLPQA